MNQPPQRTQPHHMIQFTVIGIPKAQPRAKACIRGKHAAVYDPGTANDWKTSVKYAAVAVWDRRQSTAPIELGIVFRIPRPRSHFRSNGELKPNAPQWVTKKPDLDNLEKAVMDAITDLGIWADDSQVCIKWTQKVFTGIGHLQQGATITIKERF